MLSQCNNKHIMYSFVITYYSSVSRVRNLQDKFLGEQLKQIILMTDLKQ